MQFDLSPNLLFTTKFPRPNSFDEPPSALRLWSFQSLNGKVNLVLLHPFQKVLFDCIIVEPSSTLQVFASYSTLPDGVSVPFFIVAVYFVFEIRINQFSHLEHYPQWSPMYSAVCHLQNLRGGTNGGFYTSFFALIRTESETDTALQTRTSSVLFSLCFRLLQFHKTF